MQTNRAVWWNPVEKKKISYFIAALLSCVVVLLLNGPCKLLYLYLYLLQHFLQGQIETSLCLSSVVV